MSCFSDFFAANSLFIRYFTEKKIVIDLYFGNLKSSYICNDFSQAQSYTIFDSCQINDRINKFIRNLRRAIFFWFFVASNLLSDGFDDFDSLSLALISIDQMS